MIEMTYKGNAKDNNGQKTQMIPKNIRQIGEAGKERKVYLEDYAVTYIQQVAAAVLLGEIHISGSSQYVFVNGAVEVESAENGEIDWERLYREVKEHFGDREIIGYYRKMDEEPMEITEEVGELFRSNFAEENNILILRDAEENEEVIFLVENGLLKQQTGYYIYYEKNQLMQEYMVQKNEGRSVEQETVVQDKAIKNFRKIIGEKQEEKKEQEPKPKSPRLLYTASTFLVLVIAVIGVTIMNNNDKMDRVESTLADLNKQTEEQNGLLQNENSEKLSKATEKATEVSKENQLSDSEGQGETDVASESSGEEETQQNSEEASAQPESTEPVSEAESAETNAEQAENRNTPETEEQPANPGETQAASAPVQTAPAQSSYIVKAGDTLADICRMYYGNLENLEEICKMNEIQDPNTIILGQKIMLP